MNSAFSLFFASPFLFQYEEDIDEEKTKELIRKEKEFIKKEKEQRIAKWKKEMLRYEWRNRIVFWLRQYGLSSVKCGELIGVSQNRVREIEFKIARKKGIKQYKIATSKLEYQFKAWRKGEWDTTQDVIGDNSSFIGIGRY